MTTSCLVTQRLGVYSPDGLDADEQPEWIPISGKVKFMPNILTGDSFRITDSDGKRTSAPKSYTADIIDGVLSDNGTEGIRLFAAGPNSNPEKLSYTARYLNLTANGDPVTLRDFAFEVFPGGHVDLTDATPVAGTPAMGTTRGEPGAAPYIGVNGNWWVDGKDLGVAVAGVDDLTALVVGVAGVARRNTARIKSLVESLAGKADKTDLAGKADKTDLAGKADKTTVDASLATKADVSAVDGLSALVVGVLGATRRNATRIRDLGNALATKADSTAVADLSALTSTAIGAGRRNASRIGQLATALTTKADVSTVEAVASQKADTSTLDARVPSGGLPGQLLMSTPGGGRWSWADRHPTQYHDTY